MWVFLCGDRFGMLAMDDGEGIGCLHGDVSHSRERGWSTPNP